MKHDKQKTKNADFVIEKILVHSTFKLKMQMNQLHETPFLSNVIRSTNMCFSFICLFNDTNINTILCI